MHAMEEFYKQMLVKVSIPVAKFCKELVALKRNYQTTETVNFVLQFSCLF